MFDIYNSSGYDLYQPFPELDQWVIDDKNGHAFYGSLKDVTKYMLTKLDFYMDDIEDGLMLLADYMHRGDSGCHFGMYKTAVYTFKKEDKYERTG